MSGSTALTAPLRKKVDAKLADYRAAKLGFQTEQAALAEATDAVVDTEEAQKIIRLVAQTVQQQAHDRIAGVVSRCLEAVFQEPYEFKILFEQKRGRTEARLVFARDGNEIDPMTASGGGVIDVASFALRLSCLVLARPALRRLLVLDEPFRFLSAGHDERVKEMLLSLCSELKVQIVMVTHKDALKIGTIVEL